MDHADWVSGQETARVDTEFHTFDVAYREEGDGDAPTLFLHGIPTWGFLFRDVHGAAGHAILPDLAGYGYTEHVGEGGYDRSIRVQEALVVGLLDELGHESVQVVAHDIGASTALRLAVHTDRVGRLVLSNAGCYDNWPVPFIHEQGQPDEARDLTSGDLDRTLEFVFAEGTYDEERATEEFVEGMKAPYLERDRDPTALARNAIATNTNHTLEIVPGLGDVDVPVLLLWGGEDVLVPTEWADRLAEDLPDAREEYLDRAYHWVMQDRPDAYREALDAFLE